MKRKGKSKAQRRQWWNALSIDEQHRCIEYWIRKKGEKRRARSIQIMQDHKGKYNCKTCLHGKNGHCTDTLPNACEYWFNPTSKIQGLAYPKEESIKAKFERIKLKNPWLKIAG